MLQKAPMSATSHMWNGGNMHNATDECTRGYPFCERVPLNPDWDSGKRVIRVPGDSLVVTFKLTCELRQNI